MCVSLLLLSLPIAGCGTVANVVGVHPEEGGITPFGGVRIDAACIQKAANGESGLKPHCDSDAEQFQQAALMLLCAADLPLSLIGDLVTWPYTVSYTYINQPVPLPPVTQATVEIRPQTPPLETLPEPRKTP
jgi:hypothetical protein